LGLNMNLLVVLAKIQEKDSGLVNLTELKGLLTLDAQSSIS